MKNIIRNILSPFIRLAVFGIGHKFAAWMIAIIAKTYAIHKSSPSGLIFLLDLDNRLYPMHGFLSIKYGNGLHSKHRHIKYHEFFIQHLFPEDKVLDIGSGNGALTYDIASSLNGISIVGIEIDANNYKNAIENYNHENISYIHGNALKNLPIEQFNVVILSNVLEHFENRIDFLKKIVNNLKPSRFIIRVPLFERDWRVPLKKELRLEYRLDSTHFIEYDLETFRDEMAQAKLKPTTLEVLWGEIWSVLEVVK